MWCAKCCDEIMAKIENHFNQDIGYLVQLFDQNTRKWLFDRVDDWFKNEPNSRVLVLSACAGVGKSIFAAKVCDVFAARGQLAGYHFCKFNMTDYSDPHTMLQPLASHLCENVPRFEEIFPRQMQLPYPKETVRDAFRDFNDPLHSLGERESMLIVIDALDESETGGKSELIDLISREFVKLPKWIRVFVTSRPGLPVQKTLRHQKAVEVRVGNKDHHNDLKCFVGGFLTGISRNKSLVKRLVAKCNGSFLIAYHLKLFILEGKKRNSLNVTALASDLRVSETVNDIYRRYFDHLMAELGKLAPGTSFRPILEILIVASGPLPLSFMGEVLGLPASLSLPVHELTVVIRESNKSVFQLLVIYDDCVTVFHKSVFDWLKSDGCEMHFYTVNPVNGDEHLWRLCKSAIEKFESQSPDEKKTKGQDYALLHGVQHGVYRAQISWSESPEVAFSSSMCIGQVIVKNDEEEKLSGYGFALGSRPYFIVPWSVIRHVERCEDARRTIVRFPYQYGMPTCEIEINRNNVICHGHLPLDYAVLQLSVSYEFSPKRCHKQFCLDAGHASSSGVRYNFSFSDCHGATLGTWFRASPFPSDLLAWAEFRRRLLLSDVKDVPKVSCNYDDGLKVIEAGNDFLVPYIVPGVDTAVGKPVFCWCYTCGAIVGMHTCSVLVKTGNQKEKPLIRFFCPMRQIFDDIEHQKPGLTKSFF